MEKNGEKLIPVIKKVFNVDFDYSELLILFKGYPVLERIVQKYNGLRPALVPNMWESLVRTIIMQNINMKFALKIISRIVIRWGERLKYDDLVFYDFPSSHTIKNVDPTDLRNVGLSRNKVRYITELAKGVCSGEIDLDAIAQNLREKQLKNS